jgi:hypothetical protein
MENQMVKDGAIIEKGEEKSFFNKHQTKEGKILETIENNLFF